MARTSLTSAFAALRAAADVTAAHNVHASAHRVRKDLSHAFKTLWAYAHDVCAICLDSIEPDFSCTPFQCVHRLHVACAKNWIRQDCGIYARCPSCRSPGGSPEALLLTQLPKDWRITITYRV